MKHQEIRWNPELEEWLCIRCGCTSDHITKEDAETEMEFSSAAGSVTSFRFRGCSPIAQTVFVQ